MPTHPPPPISVVFKKKQNTVATGKLESVSLSLLLFVMFKIYYLGLLLMCISTNGVAFVPTKASLRRFCFNLEILMSKRYSLIYFFDHCGV